MNDNQIGSQICRNVASIVPPAYAASEVARKHLAMKSLPLSPQKRERKQFILAGLASLLVIAPAGAYATHAQKVDDTLRGAMRSFGIQMVGPISSNDPQAISLADAESRAPFKVLVPKMAASARLEHIYRSNGEHVGDTVELLYRLNGTPGRPLINFQESAKPLTVPKHDPRANREFELYGEYYYAEHLMDKQKPELKLIRPAIWEAGSTSIRVFNGDKISAAELNAIRRSMNAREIVAARQMLTIVPKHDR